MKTLDVISDPGRARESPGELVTSTEEGWAPSWGCDPAVWGLAREPALLLMPQEFQMHI